jgi:hypothetical protein
MPGFRWKDWDTQYIAAYLDALDPSVQCISAQALKKGLGVTAAEADFTFKRALNDFLAETDEWHREGRSIVRTWNFLDGEDVVATSEVSQQQPNIELGHTPSYMETAP